MNIKADGETAGKDRECTLLRKTAAQKQIWGDLPVFCISEIASTLVHLQRALTRTLALILLHSEEKAGENKSVITLL